MILFALSLGDGLGGAAERGCRKGPVMTWLGWTMLTVSLTAAATGCSSECESPVQIRCCVGGCKGVTTTPAVCTPTGLTCPAGSVPFGECPEDVLVCGSDRLGPDGGP